MTSYFWTQPNHVQSLQTDLFSDFGDGKGKPGHPTRVVVVVVDDSGSTNNTECGGGGRGGGGGRRAPAVVAVAPAATEAAPAETEAAPAETEAAPAATEAATEAAVLPAVAPAETPRELALKARKENQTPLILIAEVEGAYEVLRELSIKYNLEGTTIYMFAFATTTRLLFKQHIGSNQKDQLQHIAQSHASLHKNPEFGGTCLVKALDEVVKVIGKNTPSDLIIASDGRTQDENPAAGITVRSMLENNFSKSRLIAIGAGSIGGSPGGASIVYSRCGYGNIRETLKLILGDDGVATPALPTPGEVNAVAPILHGFAQCDVSFFTGLVEIMNGESVYAPAFRDYTALRAAVCHLLNECNEKTAVYKKKYAIDGLIPINSSICEKMQFLAEKKEKDLGITFFVSVIKTRYVIIMGTDGVFFQVALDSSYSSLIKDEDVSGYYVKVHNFPLTYTLAGKICYKIEDELPNASHGTTCYKALLTPDRFLRARPIIETF